MEKSLARPDKNKNVRAVVIDDSPTARDLLVSLLDGAGDIQVVGFGSSGEDAVRLTKQLKPDVLVMDILMKGMDGLEATRHIMREFPLPIILVTASLDTNETDLTFRAIKTGALNVTQKPGLNQPELCDNLIKMVRLMAGLPVVHHWGRAENAQRSTGKLPSSTGKRINTNNSGPLIHSAFQLPPQLCVVGIGASTGGPGALATILNTLPSHFPWPVLIVQHVTPGFGHGMAQWLNTQTSLKVRIAEAGDIPEAGLVLLAPDDDHMQINLQGRINLLKEPPYRGIRPSANYLFRSMAAYYGPRAMGILLTGMGDDGADGLGELHRAGGLTIAQDERSSVVYGMPRAALELGAASGILSPEEIGALLARFAQEKI